MQLIIYQILTLHLKTLRIFTKYVLESHLFLVNNNSLPSDKVLRFRHSICERIQKVIMAIYDKIKNKKLQYDINRDTVKIPASSSCSIDQ